MKIYSTAKNLYGGGCCGEESVNITDELGVFTSRVYLAEYRAFTEARAFAQWMLKRRAPYPYITRQPDGVVQKVYVGFNDQGTVYVKHVSTAPWETGGKETVHNFFVYAYEIPETVPFPGTEYPGMR